MDLTEYRKASHAVWEAMAAGWDREGAALEEAFRPVTDRMVELLAPMPDEIVLELASGTGIVGLAAAAALGGRGRVVMSDFSPAMLAVARRRGEELGLEGLEFRVIDAERMDLPDASVDAVVCRFGYMLMADPQSAMAETRRVLRPGGRLVLAVWAEAARNQWATLPSAAAVTHGHLPPPPPGTPGIDALADPERLLGLIAGAGLEDARLEEVGVVWTFPDEPTYWSFVERVAGPVSLLLERLDADQRAALRADIAGRLEPFRDGGGYAFPGVAVIATAAAPIGG
jgi:SAM-dependent methyltransferase